MNCQECLSELATGSLRDLTPESEVMRHCSTCPDCGPLATVLRDREYNAATILNSLPPMSNPISVAETAGELSRRRRVGKFVVFLTGAALVATISTSLFVTQFGRQMMGADKLNLQTETFKLSCLSAEQAADIISPYIRSNGSTYSVSNSLSTVTVRAKPEELAKTKRLLEQYESDPKAACRHSPFEDVDAILKKYGGPPPDPNAAPVLAPPTDAAPPVKKN